ncbi:MAG: AraC family transcriptional regulator [Vallitaleaceae bacterium]|nr:AraC family transcriptional regulator [Vallitaleaceae bacterium]
MVIENQGSLQKIGKVYNNLDLHFQFENDVYQALMISYEKFNTPMPKHHHSNHSYEIHYIRSGLGSVVIHNVVYNLVPGSLYVTGPYIDHEQIPDPKNPMVEYCIYLKKIPSTSKNQGTLSELIQKNPFWIGEDSQNLYPILSGLFLELDNHSLGAMEMAKTYLQQFLILLVRNYTQDTTFNGPSLPFASLDQNVLLIEESFLYDYASLSLDKLASRLGLSSRQTERLLEKHYSCSFSKKRTDARMSAALVLLTNTNQSVFEIGTQIGYSSPEHFAHAFKRYFGKSPREYRKEHSFPHKNAML